VRVEEIVCEPSEYGTTAALCITALALVLATDSKDQAEVELATLETATLSP
jgi:hypothetical protein